jgi:hypothetical protein
MRTFYFISLILLFFSCKSNSVDSKTKSSNEVVSDSIPKIETPMIELIKGDTIDTLMSENKIYYVTQISDDYYDKANDKSLKTYKYPKDQEKIRINSDSIVIYAIDTTLVFRNEEGEENIADFTFKGLIPQTQFAIIDGMFWEWTESYLVGINNGQVYSIFNAPAISPDLKFIVSYNADLVAMMMSNGLQILKYENDSISIDFELEFYDWGPEEVKWENDSSLLIKRPLGR